ncbi:MAG: NAD(P)H-dependent oxidoreductase subunit E [Bacteroidales bacterium]|jgi:NADH-quinone oxidoreductase subunit E/NADP-reducing hydrogenase subunit HndA|nr:NAD(P)H-dependent oxidoreductase subunit E [Bacteroidales bacterium]
MSEMKLSCEAVRQVEEVCEQFNNDPGELIAILHECQSKLGYLPEPVQRIVARKLGIPASKVYGVVTFYSFFTMTPKGKYPISVCLGTACYVRGADKLLEEFKRVLGIDVGQTTPDGKFSLDCLRCVGACGLAPVATIGEKVYGRLNPADIKKIVSEFENRE